MKLTESVTEQETVSGTNHSVRAPATLQVIARSALMVIVMSGCNNASNSGSNFTRQSEGAHEHSELEALRNRMLRLEDEASKADSSSLLEIQEMKKDLFGKADKNEVKDEVKKALEAEQNRINTLNGRVHRIGKRLDELEEHLGIVQRIPAAPWYKHPAEKDEAE